MSGYVAFTNIAAMNANYYAGVNKHQINKSLEKLSSGIRINSAADDAAGMQIADSLRSQAASFGQAARNANDAIGIIRIADRAMEEQIKILDLAKTKAIQAAQDGQTERSRRALQEDISRLLEELDNIAITTSFNGKKLLAGSFSNKEFQIGAYSHETVKTSIGPTMSSKVGNTRFETTSQISAAGTAAILFAGLSGGRSIITESSVISFSAGTGIGRIAENINKSSDLLGGVRATWSVRTTGRSPILSTSVSNFRINGILLATTLLVKANDSNGALIDVINSKKSETGVEAYLDAGKLNLRSLDGRGIVVSAATAASLYGAATGTIFGNTFTARETSNYGRLTVIKTGASDVIMSSGGVNIGISTASEATLNLRQSLSTLTSSEADAAGFFNNVSDVSAGVVGGRVSSGVISLKSAMAMIAVIDTALQNLDVTRSDLGSTQQQIEVTLRNIATMQVNVKASESQIRDLDFGEESANFQKRNILAQTGSYALSQANNVNQLVLKLLQ